jgi:catechol 2,3-dioxygenase-like lactoylglutathione lyase family enzyme
MKGILHHIEIYVSDLNKTIEFYDWFLPELGYEIYQDWEFGRSYKLNDTYIVFVQTEEKYLEPPYHRKRTGLNHLAFFGDSKEFIDKITDKLKSRNITILYENRHPFAEKYYAVYFEDPDRMKIEIVSNPTIFKEITSH